MISAPEKADVNIFCCNMPVDDTRYDNLEDEVRNLSCEVETFARYLAP